jgi:hypothetical protein
VSAHTPRLERPHVFFVGGMGWVKVPLCYLIMATLRAAVLLVSIITVSATVDAAPARILGDFADIHAWQALSSDQVSASLRSAGSGADAALCLDFDFHGVSGYAAMRRRLPIDYPPNYEFAFRVRGDAPVNTLQFKLADADGDNVWWVARPDFAFAPDWQVQRYRKRQIEFAWGPAKDRILRHSETVEFTIYAGTGGAGEVCFDRLTLRELALPPAAWPVPRAYASSAQKSAPAANAVDGLPATAWRSDPRHGMKQTLTLDFGAEREFGGVVLHWLGDAYASRYDVDLSDDAQHWRSVRRVIAGNGGDDPLYLPESEARYLRLVLHHGPKPWYALGEIEIRDLAFGASANAFFSELARRAPRDFYPRSFHTEQTYWTVVGVNGGHASGLLSEDGALEVARGGFSIEPFLIDETGALTAWADVSIDHTLLDGYLPIPSVIWRRDEVRLTTTAFGSGTRGDSQLIASYTLANDSERPRKIVLALAIRPFQVNPAVQFLNTPGGISPIHDLALDRTVVRVDRVPRVFVLAPADATFATPFDAGMAVEHFAAIARIPHARSGVATASPQRGAKLAMEGSRIDLPRGSVQTVHDDTGLASGALLYRIDLPAHAKRTFGLVIPLDGPPAEPHVSTNETPGDWIATRQAAASATWRTTLNRTTIRLPPSARPLADTLRTALADILISRDGEALQPGTRAYARSWIRDGAMMSEALLRLGHADVVRDYLEWYAPYQFRSGKVPCCVDARGSDPVAENDSQGELIHLVHEVWRYTGDRALLERMWPHVDAAARYMDELRTSERGALNEAPARRMFHGLMPASISHEGYSAKPMHSYWDDFWALTGYKDAVDIAAALGHADAAQRLRRSRDEFSADLQASLRSAVAAHHIGYLPGSAELGDFDATSTTIALAPAGEQASLPQDLLQHTFERYWDEFVARRDGAAWKDYTPYEWRNVGAFVRLGWRERAAQVSDFLMLGRRPAGWNQWAEVVGRDPRESRFIGDMPHGWVASDFIRATLDRLAYERARDHALVLAAGVPPAWLDDAGIAFAHLHTPYGELGYSLRRVGGAVHLQIDADGITMPPGGFVLALADNDPLTMRIRGTPARWHDGELKVIALPADIFIETSARQPHMPVAPAPRRVHADAD